MPIGRFVFLVHSLVRLFQNVIYWDSHLAMDDFVHKGEPCLSSSLGEFRPLEVFQKGSDAGHVMEFVLHIAGSSSLDRLDFVDVLS